MSLSRCAIRLLFSVVVSLMTPFSNSFFALALSEYMHRSGLCRQ